MPENNSSFGTLLYEHRNRQMTRKDLAKKVNLSQSYLSLLENDKGRKPKRYVINDIADALKLSFEQRNALLKAAGHEIVTIRPEAAEDLYSVLRDLELKDDRETALLIGELKASAKKWKLNRDAREKAVEKVVVLAAGWQARLVAAQHLESMILHSVNEAAEAGICKVVIVIAPTKTIPQFDRVRDVTKAAAGGAGTQKLDIVIQEEPLGLGNAILCAKPVVEEEPFAVILPVDVDPNKSTLREMKACYAEVKKPMLAVNPPPRAGSTAATEIQHYGRALLGHRVSGRVYYIDHMQEKGKETPHDAIGKSRMIVGRYILTPDIFEVLLSTAPNPVTQKIELTDALENFRRDHHRVCAYTLTEPLLPLAAVRSLLELFTSSLSDPKRLVKLIDIARKALQAAERESKA